MLAGTRFRATFDFMRPERLQVIESINEIRSLKGTLAAIGIAFFTTFASPINADDSKVDDPSTLTGEELSRIHCASCHLYTEPDLLPKKSWNFLLTYMGLRLGIDDDSYLGELSPIEKQVLDTRRSNLKDEGLIPSEPALSELAWKNLRQFYMDTAPEKALPQTNKSPITDTASLFKKKEHSYQHKGALSTLVQIDSDNKQVLIGDSLHQRFNLLDENLNLVESYPTRKNFWVDAITTSKGIFLLSVGDISGSMVNQKLGRIAYGRRAGYAYVTEKFVLTNLYRPADIELADIDHDGAFELLVCSFGDEGGDFSIYEWDPSNRVFSDRPQTTLYNDTGPIQCATHDFNNDGLLDIALLVSDVREQLILYLNNGDGTFDSKPIIQAHPAWGYISLQLADVNGDGKMDIITGNGDNVDSDPYNTPKRFHGIRVYLNDDDLKFSEAYFYPMFGAFQVEAHDYDLDGDIDIAANAFYPNYNDNAPENFVYLEQVSPMIFEPKSVPSTENGRWVSMDAGDLDGDGDIDIVLGGGYTPIGMGETQSENAKKLLESGPPLLYLENLTR